MKTNILLVFILLLGIANLCVFAVWQPEPVIVEVPEIIEVSETELIIIGRDVPFLTFSSATEVTDYVRSTGICNMPYSADRECEDFAFELAQIAYRDGRFIGIFSYRTESGVHTLNYTLINNELVFIEPQTGALYNRLDMGDYWYKVVRD